MNVADKGLLAACCAALGLLSTTARSGGNLEEWDVTGLQPAPIPGEVIATARGYRWDDRCIPVAYRVNATLDPIPNDLGDPPVSFADTLQGLEQAFASWNEIPTSYIDMRIAGTTQSPVSPGFDFVNEVSFLWPAELGGYVGFSPATILIADATFIHGEDLDSDGDADVSSALLTCADIEGDGDIEFPAGQYAAGTILDNDVMLNRSYRFTVDGSDLERFRTYDLIGVATHELGHSHGLAHSGIVQKSPYDGTAATMYNASRDAIDQLAMRMLHSDEMAWSSLLYPEGSRAKGPGALQAGDKRFASQYSVIRGEVRNAQGLPVPGQVIFAEDLHGNVVASSIGGHVRASIDPSQFNQYATPFTLLPPELGIIDGKYTLPVPKGIYKVGIEPNDGLPEPTLATWAGAVGFWYGGANFIEEYRNGAMEGQTEPRLGQALPVAALTNRNGMDFVLDDNVHILNLNGIDGAAVGIGPDGILLAKRIPREQMMAADRGRGILIQAATFGTLPLDSSPVAVYDAAMITTGRIATDGTVSVDVARPLARRAPFVGQDFDYTPLYVDHSRALGVFAQYVLPGVGKDFFLVLDFPRDEYPGFPGISKYGAFIDVLAAGETDFGASYYSVDGGVTWIPDVGFEYGFGLVVAPR